MQLLTFGGVVIGILVILYRWFTALGAAIRTIHDPEVPVYRKAVLAGHQFWGKLFQAVADTSLTFIGMATFRLVIAGTASAPIGAICGLLFSMSLTGLPYYSDHVKKQVKGKQTA